jgi:hypothetical protein
MSDVIVKPYPGVLAVERYLNDVWLRIGGAASWQPSGPNLNDWKGQVHAIDKATLSSGVREQLCAVLPEDRVSAALPRMREMLSATPLAIVRATDRASLLELGARIYTIGYHRNPDLLRIVAAGGGQPAVWIEQHYYYFGSAHDLHQLDRVLRAATFGVVDESAVLLAKAIDFNGWNELTATVEERRAARSAAVELREELGELAEDDWAIAMLEEADFSLDRVLEHEERSVCREHGAEPPAETLAVAQALATGELDRVRVVVGQESLTFWLEQLPELSLLRQVPTRDEWLEPFEPLWPDGPPNMDEGRLHVPASHRYVLAPER